MSDHHHEEIAARFASLRERIAAGTITRRTWSDRDDAGRERVCLLLALAAEVRSTDVGGDVDYEVARCPAWLLPLWLAELTPWIDDESSEDAWPAMLQRYADAVGRAALVLDAVAWRRCNFATHRAAMIVAREATNDTSTIAACDCVIALCDRVLAGDEPTAEQWTAAGEAAEAAEAAAEAARAAGTDEAAARVARAAAWAARAAGADEAYRAADAASRAADAAFWAAAGAAAWGVAGATQAAAARAAAVDRITDACLAAIERELAHATHSISGGVSE